MAKLILNHFIHNLWKTLLIVKNKFHKTFKNFISIIQNNFYTIIVAYSPNKLALYFHCCLNAFHHSNSQPFTCEFIKLHGFQHIVNKVSILLCFNILQLNNKLIIMFIYTNNLICKKYHKNLFYYLHRP